ncbi:MAG: hypothetical protein Q8Q31_04070 [Nanoarchaeota archaeon]|nr:hypothetical protein [Nanoarchaeota archaeon]
MRYTVEFPDRVSNSAFIYYIQDKLLYGCDVVINTSHDGELYDEQSLKPVRFEELQFNIQTNFFESKPADNLEERIKVVEKQQVGRNWNCIRLDKKEEFDNAIQHHLNAYKISVRNRLVLTGRYASLNEGEEYA